MPNFNERSSVLFYNFCLHNMRWLLKDQPGDSYYLRAIFACLLDPQAVQHQLVPFNDSWCGPACGSGNGSKHCQTLMISSLHLKNCLFYYYWLSFFLFTEYEVIKDQPGDSYYVRAMFDRLPDPQAGPHQLSFRKDDILFIDNTMYNGVPGHWSAWLVDLGKGPYINYVST